MVARRDKQAIREADARKYEFLEVPLNIIVTVPRASTTYTIDLAYLFLVIIAPY